MTLTLLFVGALAVQEPARLHPPIHPPLDRVTTAARSFADCLVDRARAAGSGRAAPRVALAVARRHCGTEERALDDVHRWWNRSQGRGNRGVTRAELRRLVAEAEARIVAERGGVAGR